MKFWWATDATRLAEEIVSVENAVAEGWFCLDRWYLDELRLAADGIITAHGAQYPVRLLYPDQYPSVPAWVQPQDPEVRWSGHQYGKGGVLCLELRPDNWSPSATGGDVLRSAYNLLEAENPLGAGAQEQVPSAEYAGEIQAYDRGYSPVLIGQGCLARVREGMADKVRALRWSFQDEVQPILIYDAVDASSDAPPPGPDDETGRQEIPVHISRVSVPGSSAGSRDELSKLFGRDLGPERYPTALLALAISETDVVAYHSPDPEAVYVRKLVPLPDDAGTRSGRAGAILPTRVAIVGAGSIGSKIAESLLRAGGTDLVLIDGDVMLPGNLERHALDWRDVGYRKVHALQRRLLNIRPSATIDTVAENLSWQRSARWQALLIDRLAACDLILDATGDVPTSLFLGAIAADNGKPFVSVEVLEGGIGCIIIRSVPGRDTPFSHARAGLLAYCDQQAVDAPVSGTRTYEAFTEDGMPVVADDAAVSVAAAHAARVATDVLRKTLDDESPAVLLIGLRRAWIFTGHGHTLGLHVPPVPEAGEPPPHPQEGRARELTLSLLQKLTGAAATSK